MTMRKVTAPENVKRFQTRSLQTFLTISNELDAYRRILRQAASVTLLDLARAWRGYLSGSSRSSSIGIRSTFAALLADEGRQ